MNQVILAAALRAGCTPAEARLLAVYVESETLVDAARKLGISLQTAKNQSTTLRQRLGVRHLPAAMARVLGCH